MNLRQLRYFTKIIEVGNITRAAEQLFVAQPALGLQIRQLERDLGVALLIRHSRGVSPTTAGTLLYQRACEILRAVEDTRKEVSAHGGPGSESITLGITPGVMLLMGQDIMVDAGTILPGVHLSLVEELSFVLSDALERDEVDLAIAYDVAERPGLLRTPLIEEELLLVTAPQVAGQGGLGDQAIGFAKALENPLALAGPRDMVRNLVQAGAERLAIQPHIAFEVSSIRGIKNLVVRNVAASFMPYGSVADELRRGELAARRIDDPPIKRTLYLVRSARRAPFQNESALLDFLGDIVVRFAGQLGPLAHKLPSLEKPLSQSVV